MLMHRGRRTPTGNRVLILFVGVGAFLICGIIGLTALFLVQPAPRPLGTALPGGTPVAAATPLAVGARPSGWAVRMVTHPATGQPEGVVDDEQVYRMVRDDYLLGEAWFLSQAPTLTQAAPEAAARQLEVYFVGARLSEMQGLLTYFRDQGRTYTAALTGRAIEVRNFAADGRQVYLADSWAGGQAVWRALDTGAVVAEPELAAGLIIVTMQYDPARGRWRAAAVRVVQAEATGGQTP